MIRVQGTRWRICGILWYIQVLLLLLHTGALVGGIGDPPCHCRSGDWESPESLETGSLTDIFLISPSVITLLQRHSVNGEQWTHFLPEPFRTTPGHTDLPTPQGGHSAQYDLPWHLLVLPCASAPLLHLGCEVPPGCGVSCNLKLFSVAVHTCGGH